MAEIKGLKVLSYFDCPGGGQVYVKGNYCYIAHMDAPYGTTIVDISDPANPRQVHHISIPKGVHSHKVRVENDIMLVNWECPPPYILDENFQGGLAIYDVKDPANPKQVAFWKTAGTGVHRFDFDGRYAYITPEVEGYHLNIMMIIDLEDPANPKEVGRWWMPGQWVAGGETPDEGYRMTWCHQVLRRGNRLYVAYWHAGMAILDIEDMSKPKLISRLRYNPPFTHPTHTALPMPFKLAGRDILLVADEDVRKTKPSPPPFLWLVDITEEEYPTIVSTYQIEGLEAVNMPEFSGCHQPAEQVYGTEIPVAWFAYGLRVVDVKNPHAPREVAYFVPDPPEGFDRPGTNDVFLTEEGLMYVIDRNRGMHILKRD
ncbi:LVIVD repeat-containing protein [Xanthobacter pseudotagetidis]|uniref:LVIVD repeat-containing protein n=1 Tax=Xanthobacter pseudotagetidis TaxID=3119911 RepID=UPI00372A882F